MIKEYKKAVLIIAISFGVYLGIRYIFPFIIPFIIAYFIARITLPIILFLHNKFKIPKMPASLLTVLILFGSLAAGTFYLIKNLVIQTVLLSKNFPVYIEAVGDWVDVVCDDCDEFFKLIDGSARDFVEKSLNNMFLDYKTKIFPAITEHTFRILITCAGVFGICFLILISAIMIIRDMDVLKDSYQRSVYYKEIHPVTAKLADVGFAYLRTETILISIITLICTSGLFMVKNKYALLIGLAIAIFDAFPVVGSGSILVPWALFKLCQKDIFDAAVLLTVYLACQIVRQLLEPKLLGDRIGIKPIFMIMSIYAGIRLFGLIGFILGPVALVIIITIVRTKV